MQTVEDHICMKRYAQEIVNNIQVIEAKEYLISGYKVTFSFEIIPSDMKWLASFRGEISYLAYYCTSFGNVNTDKHVVQNPFPADNFIKYKTKQTPKIIIL